LYIAETTELPEPAPPPELLRGETIPEPTIAGMGLLAVAEKPLFIVVNVPLGVRRTEFVY
jgi:hypothetical protein